ncbi:MAG: regulatory protein RecX [Lachnospiraceae bacterium]|nr:regulatory protein RecX [Lachnospiraceae bacterium]
MGEKELTAAKNKGLYYLQFSAKTEAEMRKKLAEQGFLPASVDGAVAFLKEYRYLDDEEYTRRFIERNMKKKSVRQMRYELSKKGVAREVADKALEEAEIDEVRQVMGLLEKRRYSGKAASFEERRKQAGYLSHKGFSGEAIRAAFARMEE